MKSCILIVAINREETLKYSSKTAKVFCEKFDHDLVIIKEPKYNIDGPGGYNYLTFEKNQIYDVLGDYDRVLRIDSDTIITPNCPDIFPDKPRKFRGVREDVLSRKADRRRIIKKTQDGLGRVKGWNKGYLNSGVIMASKEHKEIFNIQPDRVVDAAPNLGSFKEQTYMNYRLQNLGFGVAAFHPRMNRMSMFKNKVPFKEARILHYAGPSYKEQVKLMKRDIRRLGYE